MSRQELIGQRLPGLAIEAIGADAVGAYLAASGDDNPLHRDETLARGAGMAGLPVPGMLVMGQFSRALEAWPRCGAIARLAARFLRPVLFGEGVEISVRVVAADPASRRAVVRLTAAAAGKTVVMGEAEIELTAEF